MACAAEEYYPSLMLKYLTHSSIPDLEHRGDIHGQWEARSQDSEPPGMWNQRPFLDGSWSGCQLLPSVKLWIIVDITPSMWVQHTEANQKKYQWQYIYCMII